MIELDLDDQMALQALPRNAPPEAIRTALEGIASKHGRDWMDWPTWQFGKAASITPLAWSASENRGIHPQLVGLAFEHCWPGLQDPDAIRRLFELFSESLYSLSLAEDEAEHAADAGRARDQGRDSIAAMLVAAGPASARFALAALSFATKDAYREWFDHAWADATAEFDRLAVAQAARVPDEVEPKDDPSLWSGLR